jgi:hypothetical protein
MAEAMGERLVELGSLLGEALVNPDGLVERLNTPFMLSDDTELNADAIETAGDTFPGGLGIAFRKAPVHLDGLETHLKSLLVPADVMEVETQIVSQVRKTGPSKFLRFVLRSPWKGLPNPLSSDQGDLSQRDRILKLRAEAEAHDL